VGDVVRWVCRSPQRLLTIVAVLAVGLIGGGSMLVRSASAGADVGSGAGSGSSRSSTVLTASAAAGTTSGSASASASASGPVSVQAPVVQPFVQAALTFTQSWASLRPGETAAQWHAALEPLVTRELSAGLALTDPSSLPGGTPAGTATVRFVAQESALVEVPLSVGRSVLVTVVTDGASWRVSDVQPAEGDAGATVDPPSPGTTTTPGASSRATPSRGAKSSAPSRSGTP
jgi:hypothetical protein